MPQPVIANIADAAFWRRPLEERMADFAILRETSPCIPCEAPSMFFSEPDKFYALTRYQEIVDVSKNPKLFCSGKGSTSIQDMPQEMLEFFGSFIQMDDPRHARQRGIVGRSFTPNKLAGVLASVETICAELIDEMCEKGEVDLVEAFSAPFPLLIICDMMGIPRSQFGLVLKATNAILGAGDPEMIGDDMGQGLFQAAMDLTNLMNELAEERKKNPTDDLTSALVHAEVGEDMLAPNEIAPFFILLAVAGNDTTRTATSLGMNLLHQNPEQRAIWQADIEGVAPTAVEEIVRVASPVTFMRRTVTEDTVLSDTELHEGDKLILFYGAGNRDPRVFDDPESFDVRREPNPHIGFGGPGPHFCLGAHLARRELSVAFRQLLTRLPDIEVVGEPAYLDAMGIPLVGGVKHLEVKFTPTKPLARA